MKLAYLPRPREMSNPQINAENADRDLGIHVDFDGCLLPISLLYSNKTFDVQFLSI